MSRRDQVLALLRDVGTPLDDDDIARRLGMNRHYANQVCRQLANDELIRRDKEPFGKFVNSLQINGGMTSIAARPRSEVAIASTRPRMRRHERARRNVDSLIEGFTGYVEAFELSRPFPARACTFTSAHSRGGSYTMTYSRY